MTNSTIDTDLIFTAIREALHAPDAVKQVCKKYRLDEDVVQEWVALFLEQDSNRLPGSSFQGINLSLVSPWYDPIEKRVRTIPCVGRIEVV